MRETQTTKTKKTKQKLITKKNKYKTTNKK